MLYFVYTNFQQRTDGAVGHTATNFTDINNARMEYHTQLSAQYAPANRENNEWATVQLIDQTGTIILTESARFAQETADD